MIWDKKELRRALRERIAGLDPEYISESDRKICARVLELDEIKLAGTVFLYYSIRREVDTLSLIRLLLDEGKKIALPVCQKGGIMHFSAYNGNSTGGLLGIPEPDGEDEIIPEPMTPIVVPAVAFDADGYRLGQGGGYYDRYLSAHKLFSIGIGREKLLLDSAPREAHDMPVNVLITENKTARLR